MKLLPCPKPLGELEKADEGATVTKSGWRVEGFYVGSEYYERAIRPGEERWFSLC